MPTDKEKELSELGRRTGLFRFLSSRTCGDPDDPPEWPTPGIYDPDAWPRFLAWCDTRPQAEEQSQPPHWEAADKEIDAWIKKNGMPEKGNRKQAALIRHIEALFRRMEGEAPRGPKRELILTLPKHTAIGGHVRDRIKELKAKLKAG